MEIQIDDQIHATVDLSSTGERKPLQLVYEEAGLSVGKHIIKIKNQGSGKVAVDAIVVK
jgi:hypothetical protein